MRHAVIATALLASVPAQAAPPSPFPVRLGTHTLSVRAGTLLLDGKKIAEAQRFDLDLQATVDGVPMAAVYADRGGASCYDGTMLLFAAPANSSIVQGSVEGTNCQARLKVDAGNGEIAVVDPPVAGKPQDATPEVRASPGAVWLFDVRHGAARVMGIGPEGPDLE